jgi:hypothetical protein
MEQYEMLADEFDFVKIDATRNVHDQQVGVREIIGEGIDMSRFRTRVAR